MSPKEQIITGLRDGTPGQAALTALANLGRELGAESRELETAADVLLLAQAIRLAIARKSRAGFATAREAFGVG